MTEFETYLVEKGYIRTLNGKKTDRYIYSALKDVCYTYVKGEDRILFGLNQKGYPPTLIHPRPRIKIKVKCKPKHTKKGHTIYFYGGVKKVFNKTIDSNILEIDENYDVAMNRALKKYTPEKIYEAINNRKIVLQ